MTKRFTFNAGEMTLAKAKIDRKLARARANVRALEAEERALKSFLLDFYDYGTTVVSYPGQDTTARVLVTEYQVSTINQDEVKRFYAKHGKKVPYMATDVVKMTINVSKKQP